MSGKTPNQLPGLNPHRLVSLIQDAIRRCELDLTGLTVLTEAASGAYSVTPVIAALAGAEQVYAITRSTQYGTVDEVTAFTTRLAMLAGVADRIEIFTEKRRDLFERADIVTNSGHVRPIDERVITWMKLSAVIPLMYESWEFRSSDVDVESCQQRGIRLIGTNETHATVDVFSFLGTMAIKLLLDAGVAVTHSRILVICDNPFATFIGQGLRHAGALTDCHPDLSHVRADETFDAVLVARTPTGRESLSPEEISVLCSRWPGAVIAVFWGDVDRSALSSAGLAYWPVEAPPLGHMGVLPSDIGPEPIVRLQTGSLKAAEALIRHGDDMTHPAHLFGQRL